MRGGSSRQPIYQGVQGRIAQAIDTTVGLIAPGLAHKMQTRRMKSQALLAYEAATVDRVMPRERAQSADAETLPGLSTMRARSRRQAQDDSHAASVVDVYVDAVVGQGVKPQCATSVEKTKSTEEVVTQWRKSCEAYFERWANEEADASGHGTFYDLQALVARTRKIDGECFTHAVVGGDNTLAIETIDADRIINPNNDRDAQNLRSGVLLDRMMRPQGYYVATSHPDDVEFWRNSETTLIVAGDSELSVMQHVYRRSRPGQSRGVPDSASSASYVEHLHHYLQSEIIGARAAANYAMFIKKSVNASDSDIIPVQGEEAGGDLAYHEKLEAGTIAYLNEGEEPVPFNPNRPGISDTFVVRMLRAIAASNGMSYERMARDFGGMNYSSMRGQLKEEQRGFDRDRALLVRLFCRPWWRNVIRHGVQTGALVPPSEYLDNPEPWLAADWIPPAYGWVDPMKEIAAAKEAIDANLSTPWHEAGRAGLDPIEILERKAQFASQAARIEEEYNLVPGSLTGVASSMVNDRSSSNEEEGNSSQNNDATPLDSGMTVRERIDALGIAVRSGLISPSAEVEQALREELNLPDFSTDVADNWGNEPVRRPVTLSSVNAQEINEEDGADIDETATQSESEDEQE